MHACLVCAHNIALVCLVIVCEFSCTAIFFVDWCDLMRRSGKRSFVREGLMVDIAVNRSDTYADVLHRAREVVRIEDRPDKVLCIFKLNGSLVPGWTLDRYLCKCHISRINQNWYWICPY